MKTIFRFLSTGVLSAAILAVAASAINGQDPATPNPSCADIDGHNALYTKILGTYKSKVLADMETALSTGKEYLQKFGSCTEAFKDQIDFVRPQVARLETAVGGERERKQLAPSFTIFDDGLAKGNADSVLSAGKEILNVRKDDMNIALAMALVAAEKSTNENKFKYADEGIRYSNLIIPRLRSGWQFNRTYQDGPKKGSPYIGVGIYNRDNKDQAINDLTYTVAYLTYYGKKDKKTALPLYYELSQSSLAKNDPRVYGAIGDYYIEEGAPIGDEIAKLILEIKASTDDKVKADLDAKVKTKIGLFNGYTERALDAYSRAHSVAKASPYKDNLYKIMQGLYKRRFDKDAGLDSYVSSTIAKPFPNPTTPVIPVVDPEPTTTTTTSAPAATKSAPAATKPASATTATPTKPLSSVPTKTVVGKKGTRK